MFRKVLLYGLPVYLYGLELLLKAVAAISSESLLGPTMAGAGIGFLLPLTDLKTVSVPDTLMKELKLHHASIYSERDKILVDFVWVTFFLSLAAWMYAVFLSLPAHHASYSWAPASIGCAVFLISLVLSEIKERI